MRGAFAKMIIKEDSDLFVSLFNDNRVISFTDLYPSSGPSETGFPIALPITAVSCKYEPGFCTGYDEDGKMEDQPPHGVFDTLIHQLIFEQFWDKIPIAFQPRCPKCGERVEPISGYYDFVDASKKINSANCKIVNNEYYPKLKESCVKGECPRSYKKTETQTQRTTKVAISRMREVSQDQMLYSVESIAREQNFIGLVTVSNESLSDDVEKYLKKADRIRLGGGTSRGFGQILTQIDDYNIKDSAEDIESRITNFNNKISEMTHLYAGGSLNLNGGYFAIDLISDAIILDNFLKSSSEVTGDYLKEMLGVRCDIKLVKRFSQMDERSGWSFAWKLPKGKEQAIQKGSVFLFQCDSIDSLYEPFSRLQASGIGQKREEGYGRIMICNPFHEEVYCS
ncbi:MAG: hypothetical protein QG641_54 [Candidatus Poribacteria bacterium]|nr:hypothetical protein [Candidatus Poribacteria bacterium]